MKSGWLNLGKYAYACGVLLISGSFYNSFLTTYGQGGVPVHLTPEEAVSAGGKYVLRNHGIITPVSDAYYEALRRASRTSRILLMVSAPFLIVGMLAVVIDGWRWSIRKSTGRFMLWVRLFIPSRREPFATSLAKLYLWLLFAAMFVLDFLIDTAPMGETGHRHVIWGVYAVSLAAAAVLALLIRRLLPAHGSSNPSTQLSLRE